MDRKLMNHKFNSLPDTVKIFAMSALLFVGVAPFYAQYQSYNTSVRLSELGPKPLVANEVMATVRMDKRALDAKYEEYLDELNSKWDEDEKRLEEKKRLEEQEKLKMESSVNYSEADQLFRKMLFDELIMGEQKLNPLPDNGFVWRNDFK